MGSYLHNLPAELQKQIIRLLEPRDVLRLLDAYPDIGSLFQLATDVDELVFFKDLPTSVREIDLSEFDPQKHQALITLVEVHWLEESDEALLSTVLTQTTNFICIAGYKGKTLEQFMNQLMPCSRFIIMWCKAHLRTDIITDLSRVTIAGSGLTTLSCRNVPFSEVNLDCVEALDMNGVHPDTIAEMDLSQEPEFCFDLSSSDRIGNKYTLVNKIIGAKSKTRLTGIHRLEDTVILSEEVSLSLVLSKEKGKRSIVRSLDMPRATKLEISSLENCPIIEKVNCPCLEEFIYTGGMGDCDGYFFLSMFHEITKSSSLKKLNVDSPNCQALFSQQGKLLKGLEELKLQPKLEASSPLITCDTKYITIPTLRSLFIACSHDSKKISDIGKIIAPDLETLELYPFNPYEDNSPDLSECIRLYPHLKHLSVQCMNLSDITLDLSHEIRSIASSLETMYLGGVGVDMLMDPTLCFPRLKSLSLVASTDEQVFQFNFKAPSLCSLNGFPKGAKRIIITDFPSLEAVRMDWITVYEEMLFLGLVSLKNIFVYSQTKKLVGQDLPVLESVRFMPLWESEYDKEKLYDILKFDDVPEDVVYESIYQLA